MRCQQLAQQCPSAPYRDSNDCTEERVRHVDRSYPLELVFEA